MARKPAVHVAGQTTRNDRRIKLQQLWKSEVEKQIVRKTKRFRS